MKMSCLFISGLILVQVTCSWGNLISQKLSICKTNYVAKISNVLSLEVNKDIVFPKPSDERSELSKESNVRFYWVGTTSTSKTFDISVAQLNVKNEFSAECHMPEHSSPKSRPGNVLLHNFFDEADWESHLTNENLKFISTSVNATAWLKDQLPPNKCCTISGCFGPVPFKLTATTPIALRTALQLESMSLSTLNALFEAYDSFVQCVFPPERLLILSAPIFVSPSEQLSVDYEKKSSEYWRGLVAFMGLDVHPYHLERIITGGVPFTDNHSCYVGSSRCLTSVHTEHQKYIVPSVCSLAKHIDLIRVTDPTSLTCAKEYAYELSNLIGPQYQEYVYQKMTKPFPAIRYLNNHTSIVLNIAPGTTGTKTLFGTMNMLNVTSRHYTLLTHKCQEDWYRIANKKYTLNFDNDLAPLSWTDPKVDLLWWGDTPVSEDWWYVYNIQPRERLRFMMSDMNHTKWYIQRVAGYCNEELFASGAGCNVVMPFSFLKYNDFGHYSPHEPNPQLHSVTHKLVEETRTWRVNNTHNAKIFDLYHKFAKCVIPQEKLLFLDVTKLKDSTKYWNTIINFMNVPISEKHKQKLIEYGVPYFSTTARGSTIGETKVTSRPGGSDNIWQKPKPIMVPSVCSFAEDEKNGGA